MSLFYQVLRLVKMLSSQANATVTKDVPANAIVAGTPAKIIRWIQEDKEEI